MSKQTALVPVEIRTVACYGDEITGALVQVEMRSVSEFVAIMATNSPTCSENIQETTDE